MIPNEAAIPNLPIIANVTEIHRGSVLHESQIKYLYSLVFEIETCTFWDQHAAATG